MTEQESAQIMDIDRVHPELVWRIVFELKVVPDWTTNLDAAAILPHPPEHRLSITVAPDGIHVIYNQHLKDSVRWFVHLMTTKPEESEALVRACAWLEYRRVMKGAQS